MFWDKVEILRKPKKLTYRAIAGIMGTAETTVSSMRKFGTEPRVSDAVKIADALGVEIRELVDWKKKADRRVAEYYCIMVQTGAEERFRNDALKCLEVADDSRIYFFRKTMRTNGGKTFEEPLFPGYVFLGTESLDAGTVSALKGLRGFVRFLRSSSDITRLSGSDLAIVERFAMCGERLGISLIRFEPGKRITVTEGPLKGLEGSIVAVNRKRHRVTVRLDMLPNIKKIDLMYELVEPAQET